MLLRDLLESSAVTHGVWLDELNKRLEDQAPETRQLTMQIIDSLGLEEETEEQAMYLSLWMEDLHRFLLSVISNVEHIKQGTLPPEAGEERKKWRKCEDTIARDSREAQYGLDQAEAST